MEKKGRGQGVALCHVFPWFTIIPLKQLCKLWAHLVNISEARSQTKQTLQVETTSVVFCLRVGLRGSCKKKKNHKKGWNTEDRRIWWKFLPDISGWFPALCVYVCCVINRISSLSHSPDCHGPQRINYFSVTILLLAVVLMMNVRCQNLTVNQDFCLWLKNTRNKAHVKHKPHYSSIVVQNCQFYIYSISLDTEWKVTWPLTKSCHVTNPMKMDLD